jgi:serine/threonine protein kinase
MAGKEAKVFTSPFEAYTVIRQIGCGGSGVVFEVRDSEGQHLALKVVDGSAVPSKKLKRFRNEIQFCSRSVSKNIVRVLDSGKAEDGAVFYVMPYYSSTLRDRIKRGIPHSEVLSLYSQILDGVEAAHLLDVYHRDIKPENLLYDTETGVLVLADFGIARFKEEDLLTTVNTGPNERLANFAYAAPEQRSIGKTVDRRADIYAVGLLLNEMFTGQIPQGTGFQRIKDVAPEFAYLDELVELMIQQRPEQRPATITKIKEELIGRGHQFVELQRLNEMKKEVVPDSEISDPLIADPIRVVAKEDYTNGILTLKLNQAVNDVWVGCFKKRATRFDGNISSAIVQFRRDKVQIRVTDHWAQHGVNFVKEYIPLANEEYAALATREHRKEIEGRRAALRSQVAQEEARMRLLDKITI